MKVILSTVKEAKVTIKEQTVGSISKGFLLLVGFTDGDNQQTVDKMVDKIINLRVFPDEHDQINLSLLDVGGDILSVSQFTLYADAKKGRRPSFVNALRPSEAEPLYEYFNKQLENKFGPIATGIFGANMEVFSINDGPFTLVLDSQELFN